MKNFLMYLFENNSLPLFTVVADANEKKIIINKDKWNEIVSNKNDFVIKNHLVTFSLSRSGKDGIPAKFLQDNSFDKMLVMSYTPDDTLATTGLNKRIGRFPSKDSKKESKLPSDTIIFGSSEDRTRTHTLELSLDLINKTLENKKSRNVEIIGKDIQKEDQVYNFLTSFLSPKDFESSNITISEDPKFKHKLAHFTLNVLQKDRQHKISNIAQVSLLKVPPKSKIIEAVNNKFDKKIINFSTIQPVVEKTLSFFGLKNPKELLDKTGNTYYDLLVFTRLAKGSQYYAISPSKFYNKYKFIFKPSVWEKIEEISVKDPQRVIDELHKKGITFLF